MALIRDARAGDAAAIAEIWNPIIRNTAITFSPLDRSVTEVAALIAARQADGHGFFVAETVAGIAGFAYYNQFRAGPGYARSMEHSVHLAPHARGAGTGRALMHHLLDHARGRGARLMIGAINAGNPASLRFHRRMGFSEWGRIPAAGWKFGEYHDLVLMGLDLAPA